MTKGKTTLIQKDPHKGITPSKKKKKRKLKTHKLPIDDVKNTNGTNQGGDLIFANKPRTIPRRTERMPQGNQKNWRATIYCSTHPYVVQNKTKNVATAWSGYKKASDMIPQAKQNVQDSRRIHKVNWENNGKLKYEIDYRWKKFSWYENPKKYFPGRSGITIPICNSDDADICHCLPPDTTWHKVKSPKAD